MKKILISRVCGGLGNQLFIYAFSRALALDNKCELQLDIYSGFRNDRYSRKFKLSEFNIDCKLTGKLFFQARLCKYKNKVLKVLNNKPKSLDLNSIFLSHFSPYFLENFSSINIHKKKFIEGYWQSYKYFDHKNQFLRNQLCIPKSLTKKTLDISKKLSNCNSVGIHFRFYEKDILSKYNLNIIYYVNAIRYIKRKVNSPKFYIFTDNAILAKKMLEDLDIEYELISKANLISNEVNELYLLSLCRHVIISNSTFSWWGAWLTDKDKKIIISPDIFLNGPYCAWGFDGLIPEHWIKLPVLNFI